MLRTDTMTHEDQESWRDQLDEARKKVEYEREQHSWFVRTCITEQLLPGGRAREEGEILEELERRRTRRDTAVGALRRLVEEVRRHGVDGVTQEVIRAAEACLAEGP